VRKCADDMISGKRKEGKKERGKGTVCLAYDISYVCSRCARVPRAWQRKSSSPTEKQCPLYNVITSLSSGPDEYQRMTNRGTIFGQ